MRKKTGRLCWETNKGEWRVTERGGGGGDSGIREIETVFFIWLRKIPEMEKGCCGGGRM